LIKLKEFDWGIELQISFSITRSENGDEHCANPMLGVPLRKSVAQVFIARARNKGSQ